MQAFPWRALYCIKYHYEKINFVNSSCIDYLEPREVDLLTDYIYLRTSQTISKPIILYEWFKVARAIETTPSLGLLNKQEINVVDTTLPAILPISPILPPLVALPTKSSETKLGQTEILHSCSQCVKVEEVLHKFQRCSKCKAVFYCSLDCQRAAWPSHKLICSLPTWQ